MPTFSADYLRTLSAAILGVLGAPIESARVVGDSLVEANLVGHDSHGVIRLPGYARFAQAGRVVPDAIPEAATVRPGAIHIDGHWGWGQVAARLATELVSDRARDSGVAAATIGNCNHVGRLGAYVEAVAQAGMGGLAVCNAPAAVALYGGSERLLGTNPIAIAVPGGAGQPPLLVDIATSVVAEGKLNVARAKGERVAPGLLLNRDGRPSEEPADFYDGGALLPFGGHKGSGLSVMVELLGGALSGMAPAALPEYRIGNGTLLIALDIAAFVPLDRFRDQVRRFCERLKASRTAEGFDGVLLPGEPELRAREQRAREGIALPEQTWNEIHALAGELNVSI